LFFANRYEETEVRKKLEEKERQELNTKKEATSVKDVGRGSPKASSPKNRKVEMSFICRPF